MAETEGVGEGCGADECGVVVQDYSRCYPDDEVHEDEEGDDPDAGGGERLQEGWPVEDGEEGGTPEAEARHDGCRRLASQRTMEGVQREERRAGRLLNDRKDSEAWPAPMSVVADVFIA